MTFVSKRVNSKILDDRKYHVKILDNINKHFKIYSMLDKSVEYINEQPTREAEVS